MSSSINDLPDSDPLTLAFLKTMTAASGWQIKVDSKFNSNKPLLLDIDTGEGCSTVHLNVDIGSLSELELITRVKKCGEWFGLLRTGEINAKNIINDTVVGLMQQKTMLRVDSVKVGRNAQVRTRTVSSGSDRTKADLKYLMKETGKNIRVLGSVLKTSSMHLDHHVEILHNAPKTFNRLS